MRKLFYLILLVIFGVLSFQLYRLYQQENQLSGDLEKTQKQLGSLEEENKKLQADINYFMDPENLAKELKSKFDYKRPGEQMMIIIPQR